MSQIELKAYNPKDLKKRSFISIKVHNKWVKEYNGNKIGVNIKPNLATTIRNRTAQLNELLFAFKEAIKNKTYPLEPRKERLTTTYVLSEALKSKSSLKLSPKYLRNLKATKTSFLQFLTEEEKQGEIIKIQNTRIQKFLEQFSSSGTYYSNKRRDLGVLLSQVVHQFEIEVPNIKNTHRLKSKPNLHKIYNEEQLKAVLGYLKLHHYNLYLCATISYYCLLRPHIEVRLLTKGHFQNDETEIRLSASENKSGRIRVVNVPQFLADELRPLINNLTPQDNIFSKSLMPFAEYYFSTAWKRMWKKMYAFGIIENQQTLYSFRHTSAVNIYRRTGKIHLLQEAMGHADFKTTIIYIRNLAIQDNEAIKDILPQIALE